MTEPTKEELTEQMYQKNRKHLRDQDGMADLYVYNLENFAHRYFESSQTIKCHYENKTFWVEYVESDILIALKWPNPILKKELIALCKNYPGSQSKTIQIRLEIGTKVLNAKEIECFAAINWDFPSFKDKTLGKEKRVTFLYDDPIELRNKHAALLEQVCELF